MNSRLPAIENALQNIQATCEKRLSKLYPAGIPEDIDSRYQQELSYLKKSPLIDDFEIFRRLCLEAEKSSNLIHARGTIPGSFLCFLLGNNSLNPLPVHYYCPDCGHYEKVMTHLFGIDLPPKKCPFCGREILADGFNVSAECAWPIIYNRASGIEYTVNSEFFPFAKKVLQNLYPDSEIVPWGRSYANAGDSTLLNIRQGGYVILPPGNTIQDFQDMISYLENGDICFYDSLFEIYQLPVKPVLLSISDHLDNLIQLQRATGVYVNEINNRELRTITCNTLCKATIHSKKMLSLFYTINPKTYKDMISVSSCCHSTFIFNIPGESRSIDMEEFEKMLSSESFKKYPCFTREDFFDYMIEAGVERSIAHNTYDQIRKGYAVSNSKHQAQLFSLPFPEELKEVAANYEYLFPRMVCALEIQTLARLTYYAQIDHRAFTRIFLSKKHS